MLFQLFVCLRSSNGQLCLLLRFKVILFKFVLFLDATPTESEKEVFDVVHCVLDAAPQILQELQGYQGAGEEIRQVSAIIVSFCRRNVK